MAPPDFQVLSNFIWSVADLLRGPYRPPQYERVMLPLVVLRRFDCVLEATKPAVVKKWESMKGGKVKDVDPILNRVAGGGKDLGYHNHSKLDFKALRGDPNSIRHNLSSYINGFSTNVRKIFERFEFHNEIEKLEESNRLYLIVSRFADMDLHPDRVDNMTMGLVFEDLIRRFNEAANETAGDHFTPREVIRLMVNLLLEPDDAILTKPGKAITVLDPTCGTGGMLSESYNWITQHNSKATVILHGQDYNPRSYAVAASDLLIKGLDGGGIAFGDTLVDDKFHGQRFDYLIANPPFGVDWKAQQPQVKREAERRFAGRFGPGLPRVSDGALLFLLHMVSHFEDVDPKNDKHGSRCAVVFNGSPLFTGGAGSGESEIRRWIIERDMLEAIVALPEQMFYNTGIGTFIWIVTNRKAKERKGRIQLIDARGEERWTPMRRSLGDKRRYMNEPQINVVSKEHGKLSEGATSKLLPNAYFGYRRVTIERPLRLRFQITQQAKETFLDSVPDFLDAVLAMEAELGSEPIMDWNSTWRTCEKVAKREGAKWTTANKKYFRQCFTVVDPDAKPVFKKESSLAEALTPALMPKQAFPEKMSTTDRAALVGVYTYEKTKDLGRVYEPDPALRDVENVPLQEDIVSYFLREVRPYVADAWMDREGTDELDGGIGKVGYEVNFNRVFFKYTQPDKLEDIDRDLKKVETKILELLEKVTHDVLPK